MANDMSEDPSEKVQAYAGMTVNERLFAAGLIDEFDDSARRRDRDRMIELLRRVNVELPESSVDTILAHPDRYGF